MLMEMKREDQGDTGVAGLENRMLVPLADTGNASCGW